MPPFLSILHKRQIKGQEITAGVLSELPAQPPVIS